MDKLKATFSRGNKEGEAVDAGSTRLSGPGSHFPSPPTSAGDNVGSTIPSHPVDAPSDNSTSPAAAAATAGPEQGGSGHIGTVDASQVSQSLPAAGQTTTYSTHHLAAGDPTPSVADKSSLDPTTFKRPEGTVGATGVPPHAAEAAAYKALTGSSRGEGMPGAFPGESYENPYKAENLDPRVDNLPIRSKDDKHAGQVAATAATSTSAAASSSLTPTANTTARSTEYDEKVAPASEPVPTDHNQQSTGFVGKALAAVGLGGAAGAAGYGLANRDEDESAVRETSPAGSTPQPRHARKESIPTTAYPAGVDSPRPINSPVGGTSRGSERTADASSHNFGRDAAVGTVGLGAAGAAGYGVSKLTDDSQGQTAVPPTSAHQATTTPASATTLGQDNTSRLRDDLAAQPSGISEQAKGRATGYDEEPSSSNTAPVAVAGAGAGTAAAGSAYVIGGGETKSSYDTVQQGRTAERLEQPVTSSPTASNDPLASRPQQEDHTARNTALAAGGAAALGAGAAGTYAATRGDQQPYGHTAIYGPGFVSNSSQPPISSQRSTATGVGAESSPSQTTAPTADAAEDQEDHSKRNAALPAAAGVGAVGAGAYAAHEYSDKKTEQEAARQQAAFEKERAAAEKARADQDKAHKKELEKQEKAAAKEEKKHQKEVDKIEKKQQKEAEKQAKKDEKEAAAIEKQRTKEEEERQRQEEEDRKKAAATAAAAGGVGVAGAGAYAYEKSKDDDTPTSPKSAEKEKKPGLFKRIFKRRKNKDTGESEEYSSDEEEKDDSHKGAAVAGAAVGGTALGAGAAYGAHEYSESNKARDPTAVSPTTSHEPQSRYEAVSGGAVKPSYNPLSKDDPSKATAAEDRTGHQAEPLRYDDQRATEPASVLTGTPAKDPAAAKGLEEHEHKRRPTEPTTGLAYDPAKDPAAAQRLSEGGDLHDSAISDRTPNSPGRGGSESGTNNEPESPGSSSRRGFRQKIKEAITGHKEEDQHEHSEHNVLHKKPHQVPEEVRNSGEGSR